MADPKAETTPPPPEPAEPASFTDDELAGLRALPDVDVIMLALSLLISATVRLSRHPVAEDLRAELVRRIGRPKQ